MQRKFATLGAETFDIAIIGGGITGSCIARDAARRGLKTALIEKRDFSCGTSAGSTKLVHGGLRYLKTLELSLIRESLRERRVWEHLAPHMVYPMPFLLPLKRSRDKWIMHAGLSLYDAMSFDRNWIDDDDQRMPGYRSCSASEARTLEPALNGAPFDSAMIYYDCQMYSPERLGLECLIDASAHGAVVVNYAEAMGFERQGEDLRSLRVQDRLSGEMGELKARYFVNAAGPWADRLLEMIEGGQASHKLIRSKGIHVVTRALTRKHALAVGHNGGHFFIVPWRDHSIIGTTDAVFNGSPDDLEVTPGEIEQFLQFVNDGLPGLKLNSGDVRYAYAGLRPLVDDGAKNSYNASRRAELVDHSNEGGVRNLISAIGGKWTTSRHIGETCVDLLVRKLKFTPRPCDTSEVPLPGATGNFKSFCSKLAADHPSLAATTLNSLARNFGSRSNEVLTLACQDKSLFHAVSQHHPNLAAEVLFAVRSEMAMTLEDVLFRRTGLGTLGPLEKRAVEFCAELMGRELNWSETERMGQIESIAWRYNPLVQSA